jgi:SAM-dependent methyltransferase
MRSNSPGDRALDNPQEAHYHKIHDEYSAHYYDRCSMDYRRRFVFEPLCKGIDLNGKRIADLACGSGHNSLLLRELYPSIQPEGFDLSSRACADYEYVVGAPAHQIDLTKSVEIDQSFDAAIIMGGLHHCVSNLPATLGNISKMLRPGALLLMWEPNKRCFLERLRRLWYKADRYFEAGSEAALDPRELHALSGGRFAERQAVYHGGPAYFLVCNSLVFRIPLGAKPALSAMTFPLERVWNLIPFPTAHATFMAVWERSR